MKYAPFGILLQKHVSLRFLLFPANKKIIETLPELQLCFLLERLTDPAKQRERWNAKEHLLCYSLHTFNIYTNSPDQTAGSKRQIARHTWKKDRNRNFFIFLQPMKTPNPSVYNTANQPGCRGARRDTGPMASHHLIVLLKAFTATCSCSSGLVCARNTCLGWVMWLSPLWGLSGFPAASLRI